MASPTSGSRPPAATSPSSSSSSTTTTTTTTIIIIIIIIIIVIIIIIITSLPLYFFSFRRYYTHILNMYGFTYEWLEAARRNQSQHALRPLQPVGWENSQVRAPFWPCMFCLIPLGYFFLVTHI
jgi:hypothetical protein